jgi:hypothetical protein
MIYEAIIFGSCVAAISIFIYVLGEKFCCIDKKQYEQQINSLPPPYSIA